MTFDKALKTIEALKDSKVDQPVRIILSGQPAAEVETDQGIDINRFSPDNPPWIVLDDLPDIEADRAKQQNIPILT